MPRFMTVGQAKKAFEGLDDSMLLVIPGPDHSYNQIHNAGPAKALSYNGDLCEYYDEPVGEGEKVVDVFVIGR